MPRRVYVVGGHITPFVGTGSPGFKKGEKGLRDYLNASIQGALASTGVKAESVDRIYVGNFVGELFSSQGHLGSAVAGADRGLLHKPSMRLEAACASGGLACAQAVQAIQAGDDCVLAVGVEVETEANARIGAGYLACAGDFKRQSGLDDFLWPAIFAKRTKAYLERYPAISYEAMMQDLSRVATKAYSHGNRNPLAQMHNSKLSQEEAERAKQFLSNSELKPFIRLTDCSQMSDGGASAILMSEEGLRKYGVNLRDAIEVVGCDQGAGNIWEDAENQAELTTAKTVVHRMLAKSGVQVSDLQVAEVHDCFTITELMMYEAIGLAEPGKGAELLKSGATSLDGRIPVNSGGGLVAFGHPVGATGVKQVMEIYRQMKGLCGDYQMKRRPEVGITVNMGGDDKTIAAMLFRNTPSSKL